MIPILTLLQATTAKPSASGAVARVLSDSIHVTLSQPPSHPNPVLTYVIPGAAALAALLLPLWQRSIAKKQIDAQAALAGRQIDAQLAIAERGLAAQVRSANRMKWVEHMRTSIATFLGKRAAFHRRRKDGSIPEAEFHERVDALAVLSYTIILSLTPGDPEHDQLEQLLAKALKELNAGPAKEAAESSTSVQLQALTQKLLKDSWEAAKRLE